MHRGESSDPTMHHTMSPSPSPPPPPDVTHDADDNDAFWKASPPASASASRVGDGYQATLPGLGESSSDRGDVLISIEDIEREMAMDCARRLGEISDCPVLKLARREAKVPRPRCGTWGCTLPDRHAGLHQVSDTTKRRVCTPKRRDGEDAPASENFAALVGVSKRNAGSTVRQPLRKVDAPLPHRTLAVVLST